MALSLGNAAHNSGGASGLTATISYNSGSILVVDATSNGTSAEAVASTALGALTKHATGGSIGADQIVTRFVKFPTSAQTNDTITFTGAGTSFVTIDAYEIRGADTSSPFDSGGPVTTAGPDPASITTANANVMVIAAFRQSSAASPTQGTGFTKISGANFQLTEYKILSSTQTLSCTEGASGDSNGIVIDAIKQAAAAGGGLRFNANLDGLGASGGFFRDPLGARRATPHRIGWRAERGIWRRAA